MNIQFLDPYLIEEDIKLAADVLRSGWITYGSSTKAFEEQITKYLKLKGAIFNSSGTAALHVSLLAAGVKPGDEVITTPLSYVATSNAILYVGAIPVFVDVEPETGLIDVAEVEKAITKKTKAIIPVHLYGQMADMKRLKKLADKHKIAVIEDAAHAIESERDGIKPGQASFSACLSFHAAKNITSGEGGAVVTRHHKQIEALRLLCEGGVEKKKNSRFMVTLGYKYSGTNFQAALLLNQLKRLGAQWQQRKKLWNYYARGLKNIEGLAVPQLIVDSKHAHHMFVIWVDPKKRDRLRAKLLEAGIQTSVHFNPIHLEPYYAKTFGYKAGNYPIAERLGYGTITLPLNIRTNQEQQDHIIETLKDLM